MQEQMVNIRETAILVKNGRTASRMSDKITFYNDYIVLHSFSQRQKAYIQPFYDD